MLITTLSHDVITSLPVGLVCLGTNHQFPIFQFDTQYSIIAREERVASAGVCVKSEDPNIDAAMAQLRSTVRDIQAGTVLPLSADLDDLLTVALARRGTPEDIEGWARQLAATVEGLTD